MILIKQVNIVVFPQHCKSRYSEQNKAFKGSPPCPVETLSCIVGHIGLQLKIWGRTFLYFVLKKRNKESKYKQPQKKQKR